MGESGFLKSFFRGRSGDEAPSEEAPDMEHGPDMEHSMEKDTSVGTESELPEAGPQGGAAADDGNRALQARVIDALSQIYDPEIPVNIYELGLIYEVQVADNGDVNVVMTLTTPHCPVAESMPSEVETRVRDVEGVNDVKVELVWDPPWDMTMMSEAARLELGFM